ncbi:MAG: hypothetical protein ACKOTB_07605, partial [Planctomycetia bacterium]
DLGCGMFFASCGATAPREKSVPVATDAASAVELGPVGTVVTTATDVRVASAVTSGLPVAAVSRASVAADVARLFAAYASGLSQGAGDHLNTVAVGGRRGPRR